MELNDIGEISTLPPWMAYFVPNDVYVAVWYQNMLDSLYVASSNAGRCFTHAALDCILVPPKHNIMHTTFVLIVPVIYAYYFKMDDYSLCKSVHA